MQNDKTLVIVLGETRAWEKTFDNINQNVILPLQADLCICIGTTKDYDYNNPFYKFSKYRFLYDEPHDWADAFNYAEYEIDKQDNNPEIEKQHNNSFDIYKNKNAIHGLLHNYNSSTENIHFLGRFPSIESILDNSFCMSKNYQEIVYHQPHFHDEEWRFSAYGILNSKFDEITNNIPEYIDEINVDTLRKKNTENYKNKNIKINKWRKFLKIKNQFLGGILDNNEQHPGSAGILIFMRWFLWKNLNDTGIINDYDTFIITRSDYIWRLEHPKIQHLSNDKIWFPNAETYGGLTDRHAVIPRKFMDTYCSILYTMVSNFNSNLYYNKLLQDNNIGILYNLERLIYFHLLYKGLNDENIGFFPYVMYTIRPLNATSRWSQGTLFDDKLNSYIKYISEYYLSQDYVNQFISWCDNNNITTRNVQDYYKIIIPNTKIHS